MDDIVWQTDEDRERIRQFQGLPTLSETELAWAAGFFEGEGTVSAARLKRRLRIRAAVGPYDYSYSSLGSKPRYVVQYQTEEKVERFMQALRPFLTADSPKWRRYLELLSEAQRERGGEQPS